MILPSEYLPKHSDKPQRTRLYPAAKRAIDILGASVGLILLAPVFPLIAFAIKLDSRGPVLYGQERVGLNRRRATNGNGAGDGNGAGNGNANGTIPAGGSAQPPDRRSGPGYGRPFRIYKFRTMIADAERGTGPVWASATDSRITRLGSLLRKSRLDETPQLWNVLRGDMSLVGPRPERAVFFRSLTDSIPEYPLRCDALPGLTGLAQVKWRYDTSLETANRKLQYDLYYVRHSRLILDLKIMAATVKVMARGEGAH